MNNMFKWYEAILLFNFNLYSQSIPPNVGSRAHKWETKQLVKMLNLYAGSLLYNDLNNLSNESAIYS